MRSGDIFLLNTAGTFRNPGQWGLGWSSRATSTNTNGAVDPSAYYFYFGSSIASPSEGPWQRWLGRPLRCLSTVLGM